MNTQTIQTKEKEEIISLLCSDDVEDKVLACIIMGRIGEEFCQDICTCLKDDGYYWFKYEYCKAAEYKGNILFNHGFIYIGSHGINYYPNRSPYNPSTIIYDGREE